MQAWQMSRFLMGKYSDSQTGKCSVKNAAGDVNIAGFVRNEDGCKVRVGELSGDV